MVQTASLHGTQCVRVGVWQCSPTVKDPGSVWNCLWGNTLKRYPGFIRKSWVSYPGPGFISSVTWPSLPKKHYNGLNQTKPNLKWEQHEKGQIAYLVGLCLTVKHTARVPHGADRGAMDGGDPAGCGWPLTRGVSQHTVCPNEHQAINTEHRQTIEMSTPHLQWFSMAHECFDIMFTSDLEISVRNKFLGLSKTD